MSVVVTNEIDVYLKNYEAISNVTQFTNVLIWLYYMVKKSAIVVFFLTDEEGIEIIYRVL